MGDYSHRVLDACLRSELVPARFRVPVMRRAGYGISIGCTIWPGACFRSKKVTIGSNVFINVGFFFDGYHHLTIGDDVRIGQFVRVITATHEIGTSRQRGLVEVVGQSVTIANGCWIGTGAVILPGVAVAPGCVVAANSVVGESTEPDGLYAGNPARRVRELDV